MKKLLPALFWVFVFFAWQRVVYFYITNPGNRFLFTAFDVSLLMLTFYGLYSLITPRLFFRRNKLYFTLGFLAALAIGILMVRLIMHEFLSSNVFPISFAILWSTEDLQHNFYFIAILGGAAGLVTRLSMHWVESERKMKAIERDRISTELQYLRMQLNPHFLFNALNTVYIQIDGSAAVARDTLSRFSEMLRYQLFECNSEKVPIEKEITYLRNFIDLNTLRKDDNCRIGFDIPDLTGFEIAPFLLIPLIENMFKHVSADRPVNLIHGGLHVDARRLIFTGRNTLSPDRDQSRPAKSPGGIGLVNLRRRLQLIYPDSHQLDIRQTDDNFEVCLTIPITPSCKP